MKAKRASGTLHAACAADRIDHANLHVPASRLFVERTLRGLSCCFVLQAKLLWLPIFFVAATCVTVLETLPLGTIEQLVFASGVFFLCLCLSRQEGRAPVLVLVGLSLAISTRYLFWRLNDTLAWTSPLEVALGILLVGADIYGVVVLALGYFQTMWPLNRDPVWLEPDESVWPSVDVFIPTYNEPLSVVSGTVFAALDLDYPRDRLRVYVLDDGQRSEFEDFCRNVGAVWITRQDNRHAKAGNINHALDMTNGEFFAVFDCDHIPVRSFLQVTLGALVRDPKLALVQTPHLFYSADPIEKNFDTFRKVPNEGELFYGLIQDGNDLWNAAFFCGSCAVMRRSAIMSVGGIAVETVTEDAHTALKLHRKGFSSAYLRVSLAAGLATDSLAAHVRQRIRWARGMAQIFRIDNPLLGPGLSFPQRLCYLNAMLHFFCGLPRLIYLTAPLAYLFFHIQIISASAISIALYALPHLFCANVVNSRIQRKVRHAHWGEVYETVLAPYIWFPTLVALVSPRFGSFNVTVKGQRVTKEYFSWAIARPYLILGALNMGGLIVGLGQISVTTGGELSTLVFNLGWTLYNTVIVGTALAAAREVRQRRDSHRVERSLRATLRFSNGESIACRASDFSQEGLGLDLPQTLEPVVRKLLGAGTRVSVALHLGGREAVFPVAIVRVCGNQVGVRLEPMSTEEQSRFVAYTFARADAWTDWSDAQEDCSLLRSFARVLKHGLRGWTTLLSQIVKVRRAEVVAQQPLSERQDGRA